MSRSVLSDFMRAWRLIIINACVYPFMVWFR